MGASFLEAISKASQDKYLPLIFSDTGEWEKCSCSDSWQPNWYLSTKHLGAVMKINISAPHEAGFWVALTELTGMVHNFEDGFDVGVCCVESWIACLSWHLVLVHSLWQWKGGAHSLPRIRLFIINVGLCVLLWD